MGIGFTEGDYVLATKYADGDPCDHFFVGFFLHQDRERYFVVDNNGFQVRAGGFRRIEKITTAEGCQLVDMMPVIGDKPGPSIWWHLAKIRGMLLDGFCENCMYERGYCRCAPEVSES